MKNALSRLTVKLPTELFKKLKAECALRNITMTTLVNELIYKEIKQAEKLGRKY